MPFQFRTAGELADIAFRGLQLVKPGLAPVSDRHPESGAPRPLAAEVA